MNFRTIAESYVYLFILGISVLLTSDNEVERTYSRNSLFSQCTCIYWVVQKVSHMQFWQACRVSGSNQNLQEKQQIFSSHCNHLFS